MDSSNEIQYWKKAVNFMDGLENELEIELLKKNVYDLQEQLNSAHKKIAELIEQIKIHKRITNLK